MATKKDKEEAAAAAAAAGPFRFDYGSVIKDVEKQFALTESSPSNERLQTGHAVYDVMMGGGLPPGRMVTFSGQESCGKSTELMTIIKAGATAALGFNNYWDYEGSFDRTYMGSLMGDAKLSEILDERMRVWPKNHGEDFFEAQGEILRNLPDKKYLDGGWYLCFPHEKEWISFFSEDNLKADPSRKYSKTLYTQFGMYCVPSDPLPQGIIFVDSWASMVSKELDVVDASHKMSPEAQMFSAHLKKIAGKLEEKRVILVGTNQVREKPMAQGNPFYEPGGRALEHWSSIRNWQSPRVNCPEEMNNLTSHTKGVHREQSVLDPDREDHYRYILLENKKNKTSLPYLTGWGRIWIRDDQDLSRGWDPVFDAWYYMAMTGQVRPLDGKTGMPKMKAFKLEFEDLQFDKMTWFDFKRLVLFQNEQLQEFCQTLGLTDPPRIRERIRAQIQVGINNPGGYKLNRAVMP